MQARLFAARVVPTPAQPSLPSSIISTWSRQERPRPPYSDGISTFIRPSSHPSLQISIGKVPCSSSFCATGMIRSRVNLRAVSTSCLCSSLMLKSIRLSSHEPGRPLLQECLHAFRTILGVEEERERLRLLPVRRPQRHVVAALDEPLGPADGERSALRDLVRYLLAMIEELLLRQDRVEEPDAQRGLRVHHLAREDDLLRPQLSDEPHEALRAAESGSHAERHLGKAELGVLAAEDHVAGDRELEPSAERIAVHRRDGGAGNVLEERGEDV